MVISFYFKCSHLRLAGDRIPGCGVLTTLCYRCKKYDNVPAGCTLVADPADPQCCTVPQCQLIPPNATPTPGIITPPVPL
jgi:hypothetical protein